MIPRRLKKEPLLEAVWEIRFSAVKENMVELLPGIIFRDFPKYSDIKKLPASEIPAVLLENDPNLKYMPRIQLVGGNQSVQVGPRAMSLSCQRPYPGWAQFSSDVRRLAKTLQTTGFVGTCERFSLKYMNLLEDEPAVLEQLNLGIRLANTDISVSIEKETKPLYRVAEIRVVSLEQTVLR